MDTSQDRPCTLDTYPEIGGCCCVCKWHIADMCHPDIDDRSFTECKGWVCMGFLGMEEDPHVTSGWHEHGMCELFIHQSQGFVAIWYPIESVTEEM